MVSAESVPRGQADSVLVEVRGPVARIVLNDPATLNSVDEPLLQALAEAVETCTSRTDLRALVLTGAGRGFCAGARLTSDIGQSAESGAATLALIERIILGITGSRLPVLAAVNGVAAGVGLSFALACDYVLAADTAGFTLAFSRIGLMPDGGATALVAANVGRARALRMALTAEFLDAATALAWGLVSEVCPAAELSGRTEQIATQLATSAPLAVAATKRAVNASALPPLADVLSREARAQTGLLATADFHEGVQAFRDKRSARFEGR